MVVFRKTVFVAQWVMPVLIGIWWFVAPGNGSPGWVVLVMALVVPVLVVALLVPPIVSVSIRANRAAGMTGTAHSWVTVALWVTALIPPMAMDGAVDDAGGIPSMVRAEGASRAFAESVVLWGIVLMFALWVAGIALPIVAAATGIPRAAGGAPPMSRQG